MLEHHFLKSSSWGIKLTLLVFGMYRFLGLYFVRVQWILFCYNATMNQPESRVYIGLVVVIHH